MRLTAHCALDQATVLHLQLHFVLTTVVARESILDWIRALFLLSINNLCLSLVDDVYLHPLRLPISRYPILFPFIMLFSPVYSQLRLSKRKESSVEYQRQPSSLSAHKFRCPLNKEDECSQCYKLTR